MSGPALLEKVSGGSLVGWGGSLFLSWSGVGGGGGGWEFGLLLLGF